MRVVIQRVTQANVSIDGIITGAIGRGYIILLGIATDDNKEDAEWLCHKIAQLRVFNDENGLMNLGLREVSGEILVVSQFTLHASYKKGNRPSFLQAARPEQAIPLYEYFIQQLATATQTKIQTGTFGADMQVQLVNDGPVTIIMDTKNKE